MYKAFVIVEIPRRCTIDNATFSKPVDDYNEAFEMFNQRIAEEREQIIKQPKGQPPLRAVLESCSLELWVVSRTDELVKA